MWQLNFTRTTTKQNNSPGIFLCLLFGFRCASVNLYHLGFHLNSNASFVSWGSQFSTKAVTVCTNIQKNVFDRAQLMFSQCALIHHMFREINYSLKSWDHSFWGRLSAYQFYPPHPSSNVTLTVYIKPMTPPLWMVDLGHYGHLHHLARRSPPLFGSWLRTSAIRIWFLKALRSQEALRQTHKGEDSQAVCWWFIF